MNTPDAGRELRLEFDGFEGPLDLLLHLIQKHELNVFDIPIAFVTEEYLAYLDAMGALDLAIAGEYLVMAATLLQLKSRMLLPRPEPDPELAHPGDEIDPRAALVRRLLEYQRYRSAAEHLGQREIAGRDVFARPSRAPAWRADAAPGAMLPVDIFQLLDAFRRITATRPAAAVHEVTVEALTVRDAILRVVDHLAAFPRVTLIELVYATAREPTNADLVVTFLAILELAKIRLVRLFQSRLTSQDLYVERAVVDHAEVALCLSGLGGDP